MNDIVENNSRLLLVNLRTRFASKEMVRRSLDLNG
jgi:hypothetical protein